MKNKNSSNFKKNTIILVIGNIITKGLLFVMLPFFSRWLTTEDYGFFDLFCTYVSLLIPIITMSTGEAMFRYSIQKNSSQKEISSYITNCFALICINCLIASIVILIIKLTFNWNMAIPFMLLLIGEIFNVFFQTYLRSIKKITLYSFFSAFTVTIIIVLVTIFVRKMNMGLRGIIYGYAFGYIIGNICVAYFTRIDKYLNFKIVSKKQTKNLIKYSYPLIPNSISWWIVNVSDRFIINFVLGIASNGIYAIANKIPAICSAIFSVFNISWQQEAIESIENGNINEVQIYFNKVYNNIVKILLSICIVILSTNYIMFNFIFDERYFSAHLYSPILITAIIFALMSNFYGGIQISLKRPKENGVTTIVGATCNIIINILTIKWFGLYSAAFSTLFAYMIVDLLRKFKLRKILKVSLDINNIVILTIYTYFLISSYLINLKYLSLFNIIISIILFIYINKNHFYKIIKNCGS